MSEEISTSVAAELAGVSDRTIRDWCKADLVKYLKHKRWDFAEVPIRIDRDDLIRLAKELGHTVVEQG